jgi:hypothetical protein
MLLHWYYYACYTGRHSFTPNLTVKTIQKAYEFNVQIKKNQPKNQPQPSLRGALLRRSNPELGPWIATPSKERWARNDDINLVSVYGAFLCI